MKQTAGKILKLSDCKTQYDYCKKILKIRNTLFALTLCKYK